MELVREWNCENYKLNLYDTYKTNRLGKSILAYKFYHEEELIFEGNDFCCSPMNSIDSDVTVGTLLSFLSLQEGDIESEYFENYTDKQKEFRDVHGERLSMYALVLENSNIKAKCLVFRATNRKQ